MLIKNGSTCTHKDNSNKTQMPSMISSARSTVLPVAFTISLENYFVLRDFNKVRHVWKQWSLYPQWLRVGRVDQAFPCTTYPCAIVSSFIIFPVKSNLIALMAFSIHWSVCVYRFDRKSKHHQISFSNGPLTFNV